MLPDKERLEHELVAAKRLHDMACSNFKDWAMSEPPGPGPGASKAQMRHWTLSRQTWLLVLSRLDRAQAMAGQAVDDLEMALDQIYFQSPEGKQEWARRRAQIRFEQRVIAQLEDPDAR